MDRKIALAAAALLIIAAAVVLLLVSQNRPVPPIPNETQSMAAPPPQENLTPVPNATPPAPPPQAIAASPTTNESIGVLLSDGLARGDARFGSVKGPYIYDISAYSWHYSGDDSAPPDLFPVKRNDLNASIIRFPDHYVDSIRGFAFKTYQPQQLAGPMELFGVAVFLSNVTPLDSPGGFNITYDPHPMLSQTLEGCTVLNSTGMVTESGSNIKVYDFRCKLIYGASP